MNDAVGGVDLGWSQRLGVLGFVLATDVTQQLLNPLVQFLQLLKNVILPDIQFLNQRALLVG